MTIKTKKINFSSIFIFLKNKIHNEFYFYCIYTFEIINFLFLKIDNSGYNFFFYLLIKF